MHVVNPNDGLHFIRLIPRNDIDSIVVSIYDEETKVSSAPSSTGYTLTDGLGYLNIQYQFADKKKYQLKVQEDLGEGALGEIVYRGKILATTQTDTQEYKETNGLYFYE